MARRQILSEMGYDFTIMVRSISPITSHISTLLVFMLNLMYKICYRDECALSIPCLFLVEIRFFFGTSFYSVLFICTLFQKCYSFPQTIWSLFKISKAAKQDLFGVRLSLLLFVIYKHQYLQVIGTCISLLYFFFLYLELLWKLKYNNQNRREY